MHSARQPGITGAAATVETGLPAAAVALSAHEVTRRFGPIVANDQVTLTFRGGEITGLVGENGAGKSTLLAILAGFLQPDSGTLRIDGWPVLFASPAKSQAAGIGLVHQHLSLVPTFTVREQLALAGWRSAWLPDLLELDFHGDDRIEDLPAARRQRVEIACALVGNPRVLLLDEPTSILAPSEVAALFGTLRMLRDRGVAVVIVTHKVHEVLSLADRVITMARGKVTGAFSRQGAMWEDGIGAAILERMFGAGRSPQHPVHDVTHRTEAKSNSDTGKGPLLRLESVRSAMPSGSRGDAGVDMALMPGVLYAVVGVAGQGQTELAETIVGYRPGSGRIELAGTPIDDLPAVERAALGLSLLVDDRLGEAAASAMSVADNLILKRPRPFGLVDRGFFRRNRVDQYAAAIIDAWQIRPADPHARFGALSGGNMQRVLAAREIERGPRVLVAVNPVHGLDLQTSAFLWRKLRQLCDRGGTALVFTNDLDEALAETDRCTVMFEGRVSAMMPSGEDVRSHVAAMMVNGW